MTTVADLLAKCRNDYLMTGARDQRNLLNGALDASQGNLTFTYELGSIAVGARLACGLEDMYVWAVTPNSMTATVSRGEFGTTGAAHASGATVLVNPRWSDAQILRAMNDELSALSSPSNGLFAVGHKDISYNAAVEGYDLAASVLSVIDVHYSAIGPELDWPTVPRSLWELQRMDATGEFASGNALIVRGYVDPGRTIRVKYKAPFTALATAADDVLSVSGLPVSAHDILALGAAVRLTAGTEIRRNQTEAQGDTRRSAEVPAGANLGANRGLMQQRQVRIAEERSRLNAMYPARW